MITVINHASDTSISLACLAMLGLVPIVKVWFPFSGTAYVLPVQKHASRVKPVVAIAAIAVSLSF